MLTGEPLPIDKNVDDTVVGGTINGEGLLKCKAARVGQETVLAQIIRLVRRPRAARHPSRHWPTAWRRSLYLQSS
jgi:Cu+-exporting ATPase